MKKFDLEGHPPQVFALDPEFTAGFLAGGGATQIDGQRPAMVVKAPAYVDRFLHGLIQQAVSRVHHDHGVAHIVKRNHAGESSIAGNRVPVGPIIHQAIG